MRSFLRLGRRAAVRLLPPTLARALSLALLLTLAPGAPAQAAFSNTADAGIPATNGTVYAIAVSAERVFIGGSFTTVGGTTRNRIAAIDRVTGQLDPAFNPNLSGTVFALAVSGSTVYAGGTFVAVGAGDGGTGSVVRNRIAQLNAATGTATAFNPNLNSAVLALAVSGSTVYAGGNFTSVGAGDGSTAPVARSRIAGLNATTGTATAFDPNLSNTVNALAVSGSTVYAGGDFTSVANGDGPGSPVARSRIAQLNAADGTTTAFNPGLNSTVRALAVSGSTVYVGGNFTVVFNGGGAGSPVSRTFMAQLNAADGTTTAFDPRLNGNVFALAVTGSTVYAAGNFNSVGAGDGTTTPAPRTRIAQLDGVTGVAGAFAPVISGGVANDFQALTLDGPGRLYVGCNCTSIGGVSSSFARFTDVVEDRGPSLPAVVSASTSWKLRDSATTGPPTTTFTYGSRPLVPLMGDWDGNGSRTPATFEGGVFKLRNVNAGGMPDITFTFGDRRGFPVAGDFDGNGTDDVAVFRSGLWQVRLSSGATSSFSYGSGVWPATVPVSGDWNGDGSDGIGTYTYSSAMWALRDTADAGTADAGSFVFGTPGSSYPVPGDFDGDQTDSVAVKTGGQWDARSTNTAGPADLTFDFGLPDDLPLTWRQAPAP